MVTHNLIYSIFMFAIAYDFDTDALKRNYHVDSYNNAYGDFRRFMADRGFSSQQGSVLYGDEAVTAVTATLAIVEASARFPWLAPSVSDIRILRLIDNDDLRPALVSGAQGR